MDSENAKDSFEYWLAEMDDALARFTEALPEYVAAKLDYTATSLDTLEGWVLARFEGPDALLEATAKNVWDGLARYVGETFRRSIGGHWEVRLDDPNYAYFGLPQLTGFSERPTPICPHVLATASADRRTGVYFRTVLQSTKKRLSR